MAPSRYNEFKEYLKEKTEADKKERYKKLATEPLGGIINSFLSYRMETKARSTVCNDRKRIRQILRDLTPEGSNFENITFKQFLKSNGGTKGLQKKLSSLQTFYMKKFVEGGKLSKNYVSTLFSICNPFFSKYLGLDVKVKYIGKEKRYYTRIKLSQINKTIHHINEKYRLLLEIENDEKNKQNIRIKWALERFLIQTMKYTWARSIEIQNLNMEDMNKMEKTKILHLKSEKRKKNPKEFQHQPVLDQYIEEWQLYKKYRCTNDVSDKSPAIVSLRGNRIDRSTIRRYLRKNRNELGYGDWFTIHNIRRSMNTLATHVFNNKKVAQIHLGDISEKIGEEHYNIPDFEDRRKELERLYRTEDIAGEQLTPMELRTADKYGDMAYV